MTKTRMLKSSLFAAAAGGVALMAATAQAAEPFDACTDLNWDAFTAAVDANDPDALASFINTLGSGCPLDRTAEVLLCQLDPAACLQEIEPAAGTTPEDEQIPDDDEDDKPFYTLTQAPGDHIGTENDSDRGGNDNGGNDSPSPSNDSGPSNDDRGGTDKPSNEPTPSSIGTL